MLYALSAVVLGILANKDAGFDKTPWTGALQGAFAWATYDLTNQRLLKVWASQITPIDIEQRPS